MIYLQFICCKLIKLCASTNNFILHVSDLIQQKSFSSCITNSFPTFLPVINIHHQQLQARKCPAQICLVLSDSPVCIVRTPHMVNLKINFLPGLVRFLINTGELCLNTTDSSDCGLGSRSVKLVEQSFRIMIIRKWAHE